MLLSPNTTLPTTAWRLIHGAAQGWPGIYVDRFGDYLLVQAKSTLPTSLEAILLQYVESHSLKGIYFKSLIKEIGVTHTQEAKPTLLHGTAAPSSIEILENNLKFEIHLEEGYSVGLFLDQRDNRFQLTQHLQSIAKTFPAHSPPTLLNTFAYTCAFSVCAAHAGAHTTSLDLSKNYLEWGKNNFKHNGMKPEEHDFIFGDVFDWMKRFQKKGRTFDILVLDPPTFSRSKSRGIFKVESHYSDLLSAALPLVNSPGLILACANTHSIPLQPWLRQVQSALTASRRSLQTLTTPSPPVDFPDHPKEPAYLKTAWIYLK